MDNEIWKDIIGYEGYYQISNQNRVKSLSRSVRKNDSYTPYIIPEKIMACAIGSTGYYMVVLEKNKVKKLWKVHRLIAIHFIPNPNNKPNINHIDANRRNNRIENLEWCTQSENIKHAYNIGTMVVKPIFGRIMRKRSVINIETNQIFDCIKKASKTTKYSYACFYSQISGKVKNKTKFKYL